MEPQLIIYITWSLIFASFVCWCVSMYILVVGEYKRKRKRKRIIESHRIAAQAKIDYTPEDER